MKRTLFLSALMALLLSGCGGGASSISEGPVSTVSKDEPSSEYVESIATTPEESTTPLSEEPPIEGDSPLYRHVKELADNVDKSPTFEDLIDGESTPVANARRRVGKERREVPDNYVDISYPDHVKSVYENYGYHCSDAAHAGIVLSENFIPMMISDKDYLMGQIRQLNTWIEEDGFREIQGDNPDLREAFHYFRGAYDAYKDEVTLESYSKIAFVEDWSSEYTRITSGYDAGLRMLITQTARNEETTGTNYSFFSYHEGRHWEYSKYFVDRETGLMMEAENVYADLTKTNAFRYIKYSNYPESLMSRITYEETEMRGGYTYACSVESEIENKGTAEERILPPQGVKITLIDPEGEFVFQTLVDTEWIQKGSALGSSFLLNAYQLEGYDALYYENISDYGDNPLHMYRGDAEITLPDICYFNGMFADPYADPVPILCFNPYYDQFGNLDPVDTTYYISRVVDTLAEAGLSLPWQDLAMINDFYNCIRSFLTPKLSVVPDPKAIDETTLLNIIYQNVTPIQDEEIEAIVSAERVLSSAQSKDTNDWDAFMRPSFFGKAAYDVESHIIHLESFSIRLPTSAVLRSGEEYGFQLVLEGGMTRHVLETMVKPYVEENVDNYQLIYAGFQDIDLTDSSFTLDLNTPVTLQAYFLVGGVPHSEPMIIPFFQEAEDAIVYRERTTETPLTDFYLKDFLEVSVTEESLQIMHELIRTEEAKDRAITTSFEGALKVSQYGSVTMAGGMDTLVANIPLFDDLNSLRYELVFFDAYGNERIAFTSSDVLLDESTAKGEGGEVTVSLTALSFDLSLLLDYGTNVAWGFQLRFIQSVNVYNEDGEQIGVYESYGDSLPVEVDVESFSSFVYQDVWSVSRDFYNEKPAIYVEPRQG